jgi:hypothetical protein
MDDSMREGWLNDFPSGMDDWMGSFGIEAVKPGIWLFGSK